MIMKPTELGDSQQAHVSCRFNCGSSFPAQALAFRPIG
jgi:hypothetical protein